MPLCTEAAILRRVADALGVTVAALDPRWPDMAAASWKSAVALLTSCFGLKGYSAAQITACDQFATWHEDLGYVITMLRGVGIASYDLAAIKEFDPRPQLQKPVGLLFGGVPLPPDGTSAVGGISTGSLDAVEAVRCEDRRRHLFD